MTGTTRIEGVAGSASMRFYSGPNVGVDINGVIHITVQPADLARVLNELPGFTVKYQKPIEIPQYLGAVVERNTDRYVRYAYDSDASLPWVRSATGSRYSNDEITVVLANGGYEREPEFPVRTP